MKRCLLVAFHFVFCSTVIGQNIGIDISNPTAKLHVDSVIKIRKNQAISSGTPNRKNVLRFGDSEYVTIGEELVDDKLFIKYGTLILQQSLGSNGSGNIGINSDAPTANLDVNGIVRIRGGSPGSGKVLTSDANGTASWQDQSSSIVAFSAVINGSEGVQSFPQNAKQTIRLAEEFDDGSNYNPATGLFTVPRAGVYHFDANIRSTSGNPATRMLHLIKNGVVIRTTEFFTGSSQMLNTTLKLAAGDTVAIQYEHSNSAAGNETLIANGIYCYFSGFQVR